MGLLFLGVAIVAGLGWLVWGGQPAALSFGDPQDLRQLDKDFLVDRSLETWVGPAQVQLHDLRYSSGLDERGWPLERAAHVAQWVDADTGAPFTGIVEAADWQIVRREVTYGPSERWFAQEECRQRFLQPGAIDLFQSCINASLLVPDVAPQRVSEQTLFEWGVALVPARAWESPYFHQVVYACRSGGSGDWLIHGLSYASGTACAERFNGGFGLSNLSHPDSALIAEAIASSQGVFVRRGQSRFRGNFIDGRPAGPATLLGPLLTGTRSEPYEEATYVGPTGFVFLPEGYPSLESGEFVDARESEPGWRASDPFLYQYSRNGKPYSGQVVQHSATDSSIEVQGRLSEGRWDGDFVSFWDNGLVRQEGTFSRGLRDGRWTTFFRNGETQEEAWYEAGKASGGVTKYCLARVPISELKELVETRVSTNAWEHLRGWGIDDVAEMADYTSVDQIRSLPTVYWCRSGGSCGAELLSADEANGLLEIVSQVLNSQRSVPCDQPLRVW